jgi:hypothetical protein
MRINLRTTGLRHLLDRSRRKSLDLPPEPPRSGNHKPYWLVGQPQDGQPSEFESWPPHAQDDANPAGPATEVTGHSPHSSTTRA